MYLQSSAGTGTAEGGGDNLPVGTILPYKGAIKDIPEKWALCNGSNGTPNLSGRFLEGVTSSPGNTKSAGLPNITGSFGRDYFIGGATSDGAFTFTKTGTHYNASSTVIQNTSNTITFNAHNSNSIYGNSSTVQPNSYTVLYIMKIKA